MFFGYDNLSDIPGAMAFIDVAAHVASVVVVVAGVIAHAIGIDFV